MYQTQDMKQKTFLFSVQAGFRSFVICHLCPTQNKCWKGGNLGPVYMEVGDPR